MINEQPIKSTSFIIGDGTGKKFGLDFNKEQYSAKGKTPPGRSRKAEQQEFLSTYGPGLPEEVIEIPPKISKGENYKGLPYLILDHPRFFGKDDHFAIRNMFWWGNFFSITLHLSGNYKSKYADKIESSFKFLKDESFSIGVSNDQWEHHFEKSNFLPLKEMSGATFKDYLANKEFIKLAKQFSLEEWDNAGDNLFTSFRQLIRWLTG